MISNPAVVVGVDGSPAGWQALAWAAEEARRTQRPLRVVHVGDTAPAPDCVDPRGYGRNLLDDAVATVVENHPGVTVTTGLLSGDPAATLIELSAETPLLVLGRGRTGLPRLLLGSVADRVVAEASCPTVIVSPGPRVAANRVVVGVSATAGGAAALRFAFAEAARRGAELVAVHSWAGRDYNLAAAAAFPVSSGVVWEAQGRALLDESLRPLQEAYPDVSVRTELTGAPAEIVLEQQSADAAMLVLGCRRSQESRLTRLGPVTSWAARHFDGAVVVVGHADPEAAPTSPVPQEEKMSEETSAGRIVVGIDGSEGSKNALRWAARLATATGAAIDAVTVWEYVSSYGWGAFPPVPIPHPELEKALNEAVDEVFGAHRPADLRLRVVEGSAAGALIELSRDAQMIVVGSRGHGNFTGLLIGAVSARVAERAACPVLVVHGDAVPD